METSELKSIIEQSGLSAYRIEKDLKIPNGTLSLVLKGTKKLPEKYEAGLRGLVGIIPEVKYLDERKEIYDKVREGSGSPLGPDITFDKREFNTPVITIEEVPEPEEFSDEVLSKKFEGEEKVRYAPPFTPKKQVKRPDMSIADLLK